jgi:hypothetical protein
MDTLYNVQVQVQADRLVTHINEQFVDAFHDDRLLSGGAGFFSGPGASARISGLHIVDHDDLLGNICSWLASRFAGLSVPDRELAPGREGKPKFLLAFSDRMICWHRSGTLEECYGMSPKSRPSSATV